MKKASPLPHVRRPSGSIDTWIKCKYGSKKGLLYTIMYAALLRMGLFKAQKNIQFSSVRRMIFICQGNICRSPLAEAIARREGFETVSFGLNCTDNYSADIRAISFAKHMDLDLTQHCTRHINHYQPASGDLLIGMEPIHARKLILLFGQQVPITLAGLWIANSTPYIHDPYNTCPEFFSHCECMVVNAVNSIVGHLRKARKSH